MAAVSQDLDYLFGKSSDEDGVEKLERKFWALMRIMARKGLITKDEFKKELDEGVATGYSAIGRRISKLGALPQHAVAP